MPILKRSKALTAMVRDVKAGGAIFYAAAAILSSASRRWREFTSDWAEFQRPFALR
jgi:hypothetical protein